MARPNGKKTVRISKTEEMLLLAPGTLIKKGDLSKWISYLGVRNGHLVHVARETWQRTTHMGPVKVPAQEKLRTKVGNAVSPKVNTPPVAPTPPAAPKPDPQQVAYILRMHTRLKWIKIAGIAGYPGSDLARRAARGYAKSHRLPMR